MRDVRSYGVEIGVDMHLAVRPILRGKYILTHHLFSFPYSLWFFFYLGTTPVVPFTLIWIYESPVICDKLKENDFADVKYRATQKKRELWKNPTKIEEIQGKKIIDRNWTITTYLLRDSNSHYQCLKITSCRWRPPPRMHSFTATTHFKSSRSFVSPCVCCMLCRMRPSRILQSMHYTTNCNTQSSAPEDG